MSARKSREQVINLVFCSFVVFWDYRFQIVASKSVFSPLYGNKPTLLATRPLRVKLSPHPDGDTPERAESREKLGRSGRDVALGQTLEQQQQQQQQKEGEEEEQPSSAVTRAGNAEDTVRVTVTAWRNGTKLAIFVNERPAPPSASKEGTEDCGYPGALGEAGSSILIHENEVRGRGGGTAKNQQTRR